LSDPRHGAIFLATAAGCLYHEVTGGGVWMGLLWPSLSFALVAIAYLVGSPNLFGKRPDGARHWLPRLMLAPYLGLAWIVWTIYVKFSRTPAFHVVNESLIVARRLHTSELPPGVSIICDLTCELLDPEPIRRLECYRCFPILDAGS